MEAQYQEAERDLWLLVRGPLLELTNNPAPGKPDRISSPRLSQPAGRALLRAFSGTIRKNLQPSTITFSRNSGIIRMSVETVGFFLALLQGEAFIHSLGGLGFSRTPSHQLFVHFAKVLWRPLRLPWNLLSKWSHYPGKTCKQSFLL